MFGDLLRKMTQPAPQQLPQTDARLALTALLVRIAKSDNDYALAEQDRINQIIQHRYGLDQNAAAALRSEAEVLESEAPDTVRFTRAIKDAVPFEDRLGVVEALWSVVLIDGERANEEDALLRLVANLLGVTDKDSALARQRASSA